MLKLAARLTTTESCVFEKRTVEWQQSRNLENILILRLFPLRPLAASGPRRHHGYKSAHLPAGLRHWRRTPRKTARMKVTNMTFKEGHEFKIRIKPKDDCSSFAINIGHDDENIAMHFNPRFDCSGDVDTIVFNSLSGGSWGDEHREGHFPFVRGEECKFHINFNSSQFYIKLPDGSMLNFPNRLGDVKYKFFDVSGGARIVGIKIK